MVMGGSTRDRWLGISCGLAGRKSTPQSSRLLSYSLVHNQQFWADTTDRHGLNERRRHLDRVRQGAKTYLIMALAERARTADAPRRIKELNTDEVFAAGELYEDETGNVWIERVARVPLGEVRVPRGTPRRGTD